MRIIAPALLVVCVLAAVPASATPVLISSAAGSGTSNEAFYGLVRAPGGDLYAVGASSGVNNLDILVTHFDGNLNTLGSRTWDGSGHGQDRGWGAAMDPSGNVYVVGQSSAAGQGSVLFAQKLDSNLNTLAVYTGTIAISAASTPLGQGVRFANNSLYVTGTSQVGGNQPLFVAKFDTSLVLQSSVTFFNGFNANGGMALDFDGSGNIDVVGGVAPAPFTSFDIWVGKFSPALVLLSSATRAGAGGNTDIARGVAVSGNTVYVGASINNSGVISDDWLAKYDATTFAQLSEVSYRGTGPTNDETDALAVVNGIVYAVGTLDMTGNGQDILLGEYDRNLAVLSSTTVDGGSHNSDVGYDLALDTGALIAYVAGFTKANTSTWIGKFQLTDYGPRSYVYPPQAVVSSLPTISGTAAASPTPAGVTISSIVVSARRASDGFYWNGSAFAAPLAWNAASYPGGASGTWTYTDAALAAALTSSTTLTFTATATDSNAAARVSLNSVTTLVEAAPPGPAAPAGTALGVSSISWTWSLVSGATGYALFSATSPAAAFALPASPPFSETGLSPNATYSALLEALNAGGASTASAASPSVWTLAQPPAGTAAAGVWASSVALSWTLNGNPSGTTASVEQSSDGSSYAAVSTTTAGSLTVQGLSSCSTYYFRVRDENGAGVFTAYASTVQVFTAAATPLPAAALSAAPLDGRMISLSWTASPSADVVQYRLYYDAGTGTINYASALAVLSSTQTSYTTGVLVSSASYRFALRAAGHCGVEEANTTLVAAAPALVSVAGVRAALKVPESGKRIAGNRVTLVADLVSGSVSQTAQVLFQYRAAGAGAWAAVPAAVPEHPNPALAFPYVLQWDVTSLASGAYELRSVATDVGGSSDPAPGSITVTVDPVSFDSKETSLGGGRVQKDQTVNSGAQAVVESADATGLTRVTLPAGALSASTVTVTVINSPAGLPTTPGLDAAGVTTQITLSNGQSLLSGGQTAPLTLSYPDADGDGIVDGTTVRADQLKIYVLDPVTQTWRRDFDSAVDLTRKSVTGSTPHFSTFGLFAGPASDLSNVRVWPDPFKPRSGNPDTGTEFSPSDPNSGIIFDNLPNEAKIEVYGLGGRRLRTISSSSTSGKIQWDARSDAGAELASGLYFAVISSPGRSTVTKKVLIVR